MNRESVIKEAMTLLQSFINENVGIAEDLLKAQGVAESDVPSMLRTVANTAKTGVMSQDSQSAFYDYLGGVKTLSIS